MGLIAIVTETAGQNSPTAAESLPRTMALGGQGAELYAAVVLIFLLAYLDLYLAVDEGNQLLRRLLQAGIVPLLATFTGIVLFESLMIV